MGGIIIVIETLNAEPAANTVEILKIMSANNVEILKIMRKWLLVTAGSVILIFLSLTLIYYSNYTIVPEIVNQILVVIQFSLSIIAITYYLKLRKLEKRVVTE